LIVKKLLIVDLLRFLIDFVCLFESRGEALVLFLS
jgi:hypothetical protein